MIKRIIIFLILICIFIYSCKNNKKYKVTLIKIMSSSCEECVTKYKPMIEEIKKEFSKEPVKFIIYDTSTDEGVKIANQYGITKLPTFIFLDENGVEYFRMKDIIIKEAISAIISTKLKEYKDGKK
ncbi:MAG: thioredoxin family protein [Candidatus Goldbacteria bacterium]|nr:thioredoxin family protein [Candidatus Goldiibacteriota bacterium]